jgi:Holliday junction resolvase RusA-like endonuclease
LFVASLVFVVTKQSTVDTDRTMMQATSRQQNIARVFGINHHIYFPPVAQARHRMVHLNSSRVHTYDPNYQAKLKCRTEVMRYLNVSFNISSQDYPLTNVYVSIDVTFLISRPDSHFIGNDRNRGVDPRFESMMPTTQGDIDNFIKFFLDAIDGIFFSNDRYVIAITASKLFTTEANGRTVFKVCRRDTEIVNLIKGSI